jgi:hypothetical protein
VPGFEILRQRHVLFAQTVRVFSGNAADDLINAEIILDQFSVYTQCIKLLSIPDIGHGKFNVVHQVPPIFPLRCAGGTRGMLFDNLSAERER